MKSTKSLRTLGFVVNLALVVMVVTFVASCERNVQKEKQMSQQTEIVTPWEKSLESFKKTPMFNGDLLLKGYALIGNLDSEQSKKDYLERCFSSESYFLVFNGEWESKRDLGIQSELAARNKFDVNSFAAQKEYVKKTLSDANVSLVELNWSYKGKDFQTYAAVTNNAATPICYDNILTPFDPVVSNPIGTRSGEVNGGPKIIRGARPNIVKKK